jgi:7,8-dihydropterin-6-yl-methyl-4-(beta-D-ribofuranosyl)aminobenzene 5'-phosphate synthase
MYAYKRIALTVLSGWVLLMTSTIVAAGDMEKIEQNRLQLHVVFNNVPYQAGLKTGWGFACLIEGLDKTVLFDTGGNGDILLTNMQQLGLDPKEVDLVVLSHSHGDHTGGLDAFLAHNPDVTVYMPESFPAAFQHEVKRLGAVVETVSKSQRLFDSVYTTGEMGRATREQALIVDTPQGLIVITGCAHPNVADMTERAKTYLGKNIYLLMGGFHLGGSSEAEIRTIIKRLKALGVKKVAPSHCTGDTAMRLFREAWTDDFIEGGLGAVIEVIRK